jgi:hypothetical protein
MLNIRHWPGASNLRRQRPQKIAGIFILISAVFLLLAQSAWAQVSTGLEIVGSTGLGTADPKIFILNIIRVFLGFLGIVSVGLILLGGFKWMTSRGDDKKIEAARKIIINAVIGLVIILSSWLIVEFVVKQFNSALIGGSDQNAGNRPPEFNYGLLGGGTLRDVYPGPGASNIPRNTMIMVSFKEPIATSSLIFKPNAKPERCSVEAYETGLCGYLAKTGSGDNEQSNIKIINITQNATASLAYDGATIMTSDSKTFVIKPLEPIGNPNGYSNYKVILTPNIKLARNNAAAFAGTGYGWVFNVSNILDLTPPRVISVVPQAQAAGVVKNSLVQINFSESLNAVTASGRVVLGGAAQGVGTEEQFNAPANPYRVINISYQDANGVRMYLAGDFVITNNFKTVEFTPRALCANANGQAVQNSCGRTVYCLPGGVTLSAAALAAAVNEVTHETTDVLSGLTDAAGNSLDGNNNGVPQGPAVDSYRWQFSTTNELDLIPPKIISPLVPEHYQSAVPVNVKINAQFNKLMSSGSLINDYFAILKNDFVGGQSCTSSVSRLDPNDPTPNATIPFPGNNLRECYPVGFTVTKQDLYRNDLNATATLAEIRLYGDLSDNSNYVNRLSDKIQDLHQNCFNPAACAVNQANCPDQSGHD